MTSESHAEIYLEGDSQLCGLHNTVTGHSAVDALGQSLHRHASVLLFCDLIDCQVGMLTISLAVTDPYLSNQDVHKSLTQRYGFYE